MEDLSVGAAGGDGVFDSVQTPLVFTPDVTGASTPEDLLLKAGNAEDGNGAAASLIAGNSDTNQGGDLILGSGSGGGGEDDGDISLRPAGNEVLRLYSPTGGAAAALQVDGRLHHGSAVKGADTLIVIRAAFSLAVDTDHTIFTANSPFAMRILDVYIMISTTIATRTITLRDAAAGVGNALSDALLAAAGVTRNTLRQTSASVAANSSLVIRSSLGVGTVVGEMVITLVRE